MTDNEIIKALECCINDDCDNCPDTFGNCEHNAMRNALNLINRQQAEIEKLKIENQSLLNDENPYKLNYMECKEIAKETIECLGKYLDLVKRQQAEIEKLQKVNDSFTDIGKLYSEIKVEAVKEFADRLQIRCIKQDGCLWSSDIGAELKEMVCEENGKY